MDNRHFETVIIGTGFSGLLTAILLKKRGITDFVLLERSAQLGGTWRDNSYPGAEVDIPTGLYSISFIPYEFKKKYATQAELLEYTRYVANKFSLPEHTRLGQAVRSLDYDEQACLWHVNVASSERYTARFVVDTTGVLANPNVPHIEGAQEFRGVQFHTARWNHDVPYKGKRVGIIGSGCSAAQVIPAIAGDVERLTVFMGRPQWVIPRSDRHYSAVERFLMTLPGIRHINRLLIFGIHEVRFIAFRRYPFTVKLSNAIKKLYASNLRKNLEACIADEKLRRHMMPDYELGCRRVIPTNTYLPALSRENVDVDISGIEKITPTGIRTKDGKDVPLDIIVYATGFYAYSDMKKALTFEVNGIGGRNLNREWEQKTGSYKGIVVSGYPNYFKINGPNTGSGHSSQLSYMQAMAGYTVKAICRVRKSKDFRAIDVKEDVQDRYVARMKKRLKSTVWQTGGCTAFYRKNMTGEVTSLSPESVIGFILSRKRFRLKDYRLLGGVGTVKANGIAAE